MYNLSNVNPALRAQIAAQWSHLFTQAPERLLALDTNAKTIKGQAKGIKTAILYLAPANLSGENVCPMATLAECIGPCLFTAGRGGMSSVAASRLRKTLYWLQHREAFLAQLRAEIAALEKRVTKQGFQLVVRLNGTSDIRWENFGIPQAFPHIQFYDYTKLANRKNIPANYDLTFSFSGAPAYAPQVAKAVSDGARVAVVFRTRAVVERMLANGETFLGLPVVDGDDSDVRHLDPRGAVVALYAKGKAKKDRGPFVVD